MNDAGHHHRAAIRASACDSVWLRRAQLKSKSKSTLDLIWFAMWFPTRTQASCSRAASKGKDASLSVSVTGRPRGPCSSIQAAYASEQCNVYVGNSCCCVGRNLVAVRPWGRDEDRVAVGPSQGRPALCRCIGRAVAQIRDMNLECERQEDGSYPPYLVWLRKLLFLEEPHAHRAPRSSPRYCRGALTP